MERYTAYRLTLRISDKSLALVQEAAQELALVTAHRLHVDGANITYGHGLWKGHFENGATIEVIARDPFTNESMQLIRNHVVALGLTSFATVDTVEAFELY